MDEVHEALGHLRGSLKHEEVAGVREPELFGVGEPRLYEVAGLDGPRRGVAAPADHSREMLDSGRSARLSPPIGSPTNRS